MTRALLATAASTHPSTPPEQQHRAEVYGYGFQFYWACTCGKSGQPTTNGRAAAGRDRHLTAARRKL